jgi:hypothetical protein
VAGIQARYNSYCSSLPSLLILLTNTSRRTSYLGAWRHSESERKLPRPQSCRREEPRDVLHPRPQSLTSTSHASLRDSLRSAHVSSRQNVLINTNTLLIPTLLGHRRSPIFQLLQRDSTPLSSSSKPSRVHRHDSQDRGARPAPTGYYQGRYCLSRCARGGRTNCDGVRPCEGEDSYSFVSAAYWHLGRFPVLTSDELPLTSDE